MKIHPVEAEFVRADRQMDMTKLTAAFCNFAIGPKSESSHSKFSYGKKN